MSQTAVLLSRCIDRSKMETNLNPCSAYTECIVIGTSMLEHICPEGQKFSKHDINLRCNLLNDLSFITVFKINPLMDGHKLLNK